ncbi:MAG TPA: DUF6351 family protein [Solirubrobacteraceae bacterium]|jgi:hypothetical protein|nr:DUF6351 family protein [Solirubrobacteraceae bacterium]
MGAKAMKAKAVVGFAFCVSLVMASTGTALAAKEQLAVHLLSNRADLISGPEALASVALPANVAPSSVKVTLNGKNVTSEFALRPNGSFEGLVTGLKLGKDVLAAKARRAKAGQVAISDHPIGGPVTAGPQVRPWRCKNAHPTDAQCDEAPTYTYKYKNAATGSFEEYNPSSPPEGALIENVTTENGTTVPYIIRSETGYEDRDQYQVTALYQPGKPWEPWAPQPQFSHKLLITGGSGCGFEYESASAPSTTEGTAETALHAGFAVMSTALDNAGHNCNIATQAESLIIAKEHLIDRYGTLKFTIGQGCSGGSLTMDQVANAYPGVYQALLPSCTFQDAWSNANQLVDDHLALKYFEDPAAWGTGVAWTPTQMSEVTGRPDPVGASVFDVVFWETAVDPTSNCTVTRNCPGLEASETYNPESNPGGVRATLADYMINVFGRRPESVWSPVEKKLGHGFANRPVGNVGEQYGLRLLLEAKISPAQFVDLNQKIGGANIDGEPTTGRMSSQEPGLANAYRSGAVDEANNLTDIPIIDEAGPKPEGIHDDFRIWSLRARLEREEGHFPKNQAIWFGQDTESYEPERFQAMNEWLNAMEADKTAGRTIGEKVNDDRPAGARDRCTDNEATEGIVQIVELNGEKVCQSPLYETKFAIGRVVAGESLAADNLECQLKPLNRADYPGVEFTEEEWVALEKTFPGGVCNFDSPGVGQQPTVAWQTYQADAGGGAAVYGGMALGAAPAGSGEGWTSETFAGWLK